MIKPWLNALRDLFLPLYPSWLVRLLIGKFDFAFIAHPLILEDLARQYPSLRNANKNTLKFISKYLWPVVGSEITGFRDNSGKEIRGLVLFCPMSTRLLVLRRKQALRKILKIMKIAEKLKVKIVGLGAFIPIVTRDGKLVARKTRMSMTTGTSFSAIIAVNNAMKLIAACGLACQDLTVAVVGAGGSVGSISSRLLMDNFQKIVLIDKSQEALDALLAGKYLSGISNKILMVSTKIENVKYADLVIVATNSPGIIVRSEHLKPGALVVDAAQPRNVSARIPFMRQDVVVIESGVAEVKGLDTHFQFDLKSYSEVYSCLAEVLVLLWFGIKGKQVGNFDMAYVYNLREAATKIGIEIPAFRNRAGFVTERDLQRIKEDILKNESIFNGIFPVNGLHLEHTRLIKLPV